MSDQTSMFNNDCLKAILQTLETILKVLQNTQMERAVEQSIFASPTMARWKNQHNATETAGDVNLQPSKTIPDQSLSIPEIMSRYSRGLPLGGQVVPVYDEDPENPMPDLSKMDLIDQHETIQAAKDEVKDIAHKYRKEQDKKKQDAYNEYKRKYEELDKEYKKQITQSKPNQGTES